VPKLITPRVIPNVPTGNIQDQATQSAVRTLAQGWQTRNGTTRKAFRTEDEPSITLTTVAEQVLRLQEAITQLTARVAALENPV